METIKQTSKQYFRALSILHLALTIGIVLFGLLVSFLILSGIMPNNVTELNMIFIYVVTISALAGLFGSNWMYKNKLMVLKEENNLKTKMTKYRSIVIIRYVLLEGPAFLAFVAVFMTSNLLFLAFASVMIIFMIYWRPTKNSIINDLELNQRDIAIIENPDSIIAEFDRVAE